MSNIKRILELSNIHIPGADPDWGDLKVKDHEYGWVVWVYDPDDSLSPDWMKPIMKLAYQKNCSLILFDCDAEEWEDTDVWKLSRYQSLWEEGGKA